MLRRKEGGSDLPAGCIAGVFQHWQLSCPFPGKTACQARICDSQNGQIAKPAYFPQVAGSFPDRLVAWQLKTLELWECIMETSPCNRISLSHRIFSHVKDALGMNEPELLSLADKGFWHELQSDQDGMVYSMLCAYALPAFKNGQLG